MSAAMQVRDFTLASGAVVPDTPRVMLPDETSFLVRMYVDEILELLSTEMESNDAKTALFAMITHAKALPRVVYPESEAGRVAKIADQADAVVDVMYYGLNATAKIGVNASSVFALVHEANMAKRDPATGMFVKDASGKVIKPPGWVAPSVNDEIWRQIKQGAWFERKVVTGEYYCMWDPATGQTTPSPYAKVAYEASMETPTMSFDESPKAATRCISCGMSGHVLHDCPFTKFAERAAETVLEMVQRHEAQLNMLTSRVHLVAERGSPKCDTCGERGHYSDACP